MSKKIKKNIDQEIEEPKKNEPDQEIKQEKKKRRSKQKKEDSDAEDNEEIEEYEMEIGKVADENELVETERKKDEIIFSEVASNVVKMEKLKKVKKKDRTTRPCLTNYEFTHLVGERETQLARGAKVLIKNVKHLKPLEKALLEIKLNVSPIIIRRYLPNNKYEDWEIAELDKDDLMKELIEHKQINIEI